MYINLWQIWTENDDIVMRSSSKNTQWVVVRFPPDYLKNLYRDNIFTAVSKLLKALSIGVSKIAEGQINSLMIRKRGWGEKENKCIVFRR